MKSSSEKHRTYLYSPFSHIIFCHSFVMEIDSRLSFHFNEQRTIITIAFQQNQIGYTGCYALSFQFATCNSITSSSVRHSKQPAF